MSKPAISHIGGSVTVVSAIENVGSSQCLAQLPCEHRALPDQLFDPVLRAGVHSLVGQHGHLPDVLHEHRADGVLSGGLGRLPGGVAALVVDQCARSAGDRDGGVGVRVPLGLQRVQPGHDRRRVAAIAATDLLRDRCAREGPVEMGRADRGLGRRISSCWSRFCSSGRARRWGGGSRRSTTGSLAYTADILGSLAGIAVFGLMSYFRVPAWIWFLIALAIGVGLVPALALLHAARRAGCASRLVAPGRLAARRARRADRGHLVSLLPGSIQAALPVDRRQQHRPSGDGCRSSGGPGLLSAAPAQPRRGRQAVRRRADHRRRARATTSRRRWRKAPGTSTPSRSTR